MNRTRAAAAVLVAVLCLAVGITTASAQDYPGTTAPRRCLATVTLGNPARPGRTITIEVACVALGNGRLLGGILRSTPVNLPPTLSKNGAVTYTVTLPNDWETDAAHSVTLTDESGAVAATSSFYVNSAGEISAPPSGGQGLARTGSSNHTEDLVKGGVVLLAAGAVALRISRKRRRLTASAAA